jgi:lysophospholipase L1-like esterase
MSPLVTAFVGLVPLINGQLFAEKTPDGLALKQGDRVVFLGSGFIEQERTHSYLESALVSRYPGADLFVRNLGWGGDTVRGAARTGGYQNPEGLARLLKEVQDLKPTVVLLGYGMNESFAGPDGLAGFVDGYEQMLAKLAPLKARVALMSPTFHEDLGRPFPDPLAHNRDLEGYSAAVQKLAARHGTVFIDLFHALRDAKLRSPKERLTTNGMSLTEAGYAVAARALEKQLRPPVPTWRVELDAAGTVLAASGTTIDKLTAADGLIRFQAVDAVLPVPSVASVTGDVRALRIAGLPAGKYEVSIDGESVLRTSAAELQAGVSIQAGPAHRDFEKLRAAIIHKNELFYRRWRPFNDHSRHWDFMRGDYALYDKQIAEEEQNIANLRRPRPHSFAIAAKRGAK